MGKESFSLIVKNPNFLDGVHISKNNLREAMLFCGMWVVFSKFTLLELDWVGVICSENGPVERMSAGLWMMGFCWCLASALTQRSYGRVWLGVASLFLLLGLRELDFHRWATGWNLDNLSNYLNGEIPLWERLFVLGSVVFPGLVVGLILFHAGWSFLGQWEDETVHWLGHLWTGGLILLGCLVLDKVEAYMLPPLQSETVHYFLMGIEEFGEFVLAAFVISVFWPYWNKSFPGGDPVSS